MLTLCYEPARASPEIGDRDSYNRLLMTRGLVRGRLLVCAIAALALFPACSARKPAARFSQKLVILGFDGMDPRSSQRWMEEGKLPNMAKLASQGGLHPLSTTHSPESPTAWASFATGVNAGKHNIYDFLVRDTTTYLPDLGMVRREPPKFLFNYIPIAEAEAACRSAAARRSGSRPGAPACGRACSPCR